MVQSKTDIIDGIPVTSIDCRADIKLKNIKGSIYVSQKINNKWIYPDWSPKFSCIEAAIKWLDTNVGDTDGYVSPDEFQEIMCMYGFHNCKYDSPANVDRWERDEILYKSSDTLQIKAFRFIDGSVKVIMYQNYEELPVNKQINDISSSDSLVLSIDTILNKYNIKSFETVLCNIEYRSEIIECAISSRDITKNMVRVKSSNIWSYNINIKDKKDKFGDVVVQFKDRRGGPGDIYIYYDVPITIYRSWHTSPSKGHYFWQYIRNNFKYSKLTGDKRGKLSNAVN